MKKLLSILLALVMVFSLTVPAFADGPNGPAPDDYYDDEYTNWAKDEWAATCAEYPEETAQFLKELPDWFAKNFTEERSFEAYCENYHDCVEEAYVELFDYWLWDRELEQSKNAFLTERGGTPGQINVMLDGKYVKFPDAAPEVTEGRTMVPFRAIFETLGAKISYEDGKIHADLGDTALDLTIGSDTMTKTVNGSTETVAMDCAPYAKGGRTYVPVRFIGEALGLDVQWDDYYQSAVITDLDALAELIDKDFTIYNKQVAQNSTLTDKTQQSVGSGRADVTLFDSLNGDKTGKATYSYDLAASAAGASGKMEYDFTELWALLEGYIPMPLDLAGEEDYAQALELVKSLMKGSAEIRMDLEKGKVYVSMPGLFEAMGDYLEAAGVQLPKDAWLSLSLDSVDMGEVTGMLNQPLTMGKLLTSMISYDYLAAESYGDVLEAAELLGKLFGDSKFTRKGNTNVLTLTKEDLVGILEPLVGQDGYTGQDLDALSKFDFTMTLHDNGDVDVNYQARVAMTDGEINLGDLMDVSVTGTTRSGKSESTMEVHVKNVLKATVTLEETLTETDKAPETTPPEDVLVLPMDGALPAGSITSPDGPAQVQP